MSSKWSPKLSQKTQDTIWNFFQQENGEIQALGFPARARFHFLSRQISRKERVLNIGIGKGYLEYILSRKGVEVYALDPVESIVNQVKNYCIDVRQGYAHNIPFDDDFFDRVIMSEVLEHIPEEYLDKSLEEVRRVLKKGGIFMGTVPADEDLAKNLVICPHCGQIFHRWGHQRSFSKENLANLLNKFFDRVRIRRFYFADWKILNWKGKIVAFLKIWQARLDKKGSNQNFYFEAWKL